MKTRIISALGLGILFLFMTMQSLPWVLFSFGVIHFIAQAEFAALRRVPLLLSGAHAVLTTCAWLVISLSLCLPDVFPGNVALIALLLLMLVYAIVAVCSFERGADHPQFLFMLRGVLLVTLPLSCIPVLVIQQWNGGGIPLYLLLIGASWGADSGAIFAGKLLGRTPLCPRLSPKKTVEGVVGGMLTAGLIFALAVLIYDWGFQLPPSSNSWGMLLMMFILGAAVALVGVFGDLVFSMYKRLEELKDFGTFIPGHGGVLDRFDSMLFVAPVLYIIISVMS